MASARPRSASASRVSQQKKRRNVQTRSLGDLDPHTWPHARSARLPPRARSPPLPRLAATAVHRLAATAVPRLAATADQSHDPATSRGLDAHPLHPCLRGRTMAALCFPVGTTVRTTVPLSGTPRVGFVVDASALGWRTVEMFGGSPSRDEAGARPSAGGVGGGGATMMKLIRVEELELEHSAPGDPLLEVTHEPNESQSSRDLWDTVRVGWSERR